MLTASGRMRFALAALASLTAFFVQVSAQVSAQFQQFQPLQTIQLQPFQTAAQRQLLIFVRDLQDQLIQQQNFLQQQLPEEAQAQVFERRVIAVEPQPEQLQQVVQPVRARQRQKQPQSNETNKPQFLEPGVGKWLLNGDQSCLPCICEAASGCDETLGCDDRGFCGPFLLSRRYWQLAGKPLLRGDSPDRPGAASDCLRDPFCAAEAVRGYLDRFAQDCDGDRRVDCFDLARVHFQGPFNCKAPLQPPTDFSETFRRCWDASRRNKQRR